VVNYLASRLLKITRIEQGSATPKLVNIDQQVKEGEEEERHGCCSEYEGEGPEVLVDRNQPLVQRESAKASGCKSEDASPNCPSDRSSFPILVHYEYSSSSCPEPNQRHTVQRAQEAFRVMCSSTINMMAGRRLIDMFFSKHGHVDESGGATSTIPMSAIVCPD